MAWCPYVRQNEDHVFACGTDANGKNSFLQLVRERHCLETYR